MLSNNVKDCLILRNTHTRVQWHVICRKNTKAIHVPVGAVCDSQMPPGLRTKQTQARFNTPAYLRSVHSEGLCLQSQMQSHTVISPLFDMTMWNIKLFLLIIQLLVRLVMFITAYSEAHRINKGLYGLLLLPIYSSFVLIIQPSNACCCSKDTLLFFQSLKFIYV